MRYDTLLLGAALLSAIIAVFALIPDAGAKLGFSGKLFAQGEHWRTLTFSFAHFDYGHLIENIAALLVAILLAVEVGMTSGHCAAALLLSAATVIIVDIFAFPSVLVAGISAAAFALYGAFAVKGSVFMHRMLLLPVMATALLAKYVIDIIVLWDVSTTLIGAIFHMVGFAAGITAMAASIAAGRMLRQRVFT